MQPECFMEYLLKFILLLATAAGLVAFNFVEPLALCGVIESTEAHLFFPDWELKEAVLQWDKEHTTMKKEKQSYNSL